LIGEKWMLRNETAPMVGAGFSAQRLRQIMVWKIVES
jgi:hypothetical protein